MDSDLTTEELRRRLEEAEVWLREKAQVEAALRESAEKYRTRFDTMAEGFCALEVLCDEEGRAVDVRVLELNLPFEQQTGMKRDQLVGRRLFEVFPLEDARRWMAV